MAPAGAVLILSKAKSPEIQQDPAQSSAGSCCKEKKESKTMRRRMRGPALLPHFYYTVESRFFQWADYLTLKFP
jgi:hypothetical protein